MKVIYTLFIILIPFVGFGQGWFKTITTFDESLNYGFSIKETGNNGFVLTGTTDANSGEWNIFIVKLDNNGNEQWRKIIEGGSGQDDIAFDSYFENDLIYVVGQLENNKSFIKIFNINGDLIDENSYNFSYNAGGNNNSGSSFIKEYSENGNSKFLLLNNDYDWVNGVNSILMVDKNNLDSISSFDLPNFPKSSFPTGGIIDVELAYNFTLNKEGIDYYAWQLFYLNRATGSINNNGSTDFYITSSLISLNSIIDYQKIFEYGGFNDDFAYDFVLLQNEIQQPSAIIVGSTESYGNSSYNQPVPYIIKTNFLDLYSDGTVNNSIEWEIILDYKGEARLITKLSNNNYLVLINSTDEVDSPYRLIEINENGNILCESLIDLSEIITEQVYINSFSAFNSLLQVEDDKVLLLGNFAKQGGGSPSYNFEYLPNPNSFGLWNDIILIKTECGGSISSIKDSQINTKKNRIGLKNILGQDIYKIENSILFEIFDDGSVEKKIIIE